MIRLAQIDLSPALSKGDGDGLHRFPHVFLVILILCGAHITFAQDSEHGDVTIHSDARLAVLLKKSRIIAMAASGTKFNEANTKSPAPPLPANVSPVVHQLVQHSEPPQPAVVSLQHHEMRTVYTGKGYRVQIYNGPDRNRALSVKTEFMRHFPGVHSYLIYNAPSFRVRVGDYRNRGDAEGMLREGNSMFSPCMIVPDVVTISTF